VCSSDLDSSLRCDSNELTLDNLNNINFWDNLYYCTETYSSKYIKFYFTRDRCNVGDIECGTYFSYIYCMRIDSSLISNNINQCPYMNVIVTLDKTTLPFPDPLPLKLNYYYYYLVRNITNMGPNKFTNYFTLKLMYGSSRLPANDSDLESTYSSYQRLNQIDFSKDESISYLPTLLDIDSNMQFLFHYFNPEVINTLTKNYGILNIVGSPKSYFSVRTKFTYLPSKECLPLFDIKMNGGSYYLESFDVFIDYIKDTGSKFVGYSLMEIVYLVIFLYYYRGVIIVQRLAESFEESDLLKNLKNDRVGSRSKIFFSGLIKFLKTFTLVVQWVYLNNNLTFVDKIYSNNCFTIDKDFTSSLRLYLKDVPILRTFTLICLLLNLIDFLSYKSHENFNKLLDFKL
jgi:hypothetical protein